MVGHGADGQPDCRRGPFLEGDEARSPSARDGFAVRGRHCSLAAAKLARSASPDLPAHRDWQVEGENKL